jgi:hypothetical protein
MVSRRVASCRNAKEALMAIVAGFDVHRRQITFDALDTETGAVTRRSDRCVAGRREGVGGALGRP